MKKAILLFVAIVFIYVYTNAQVIADFYSIANGLWSNTTDVWSLTSGGTPAGASPQKGDIVSIEGNTITLDVDMSSNPGISIYIDATSSLTSETTEGIMIRAQGILNVAGTLDVNTIELKQGGLVDVYAGASITTTTWMDNAATITIDGDISVGTIFTNTSTVNGNGSITAGTYVNSGTIFGISTTPPAGSTISGWTWKTDTGSTVWETITNWGAGSVPTSTSNVSIPSGGTQPIVSSNPVLQECNTLYINSGATLTINVLTKLTISDALTNNGTLTINSDATGTGSLIVSGTSTGNVIFKRYVDDIAKAAKWHYVSSPVAGQALDNSWMSTNNIVNTPPYQFFRWDEPTNYWIIFGSAGPPVAFGDVTFIDGRGYCLTRSGAGELSFEGTVRTANVTYSATYYSGLGDGFNLVGNPFTSSIGINTAALSTNNFLNDNSATLDESYLAVYIWDEQTGYLGNRDDYVVICNIGYSGFGSGSALAQDYVQPGQAFFIKVISNQTITFNKDSRYHSTDNFYKSGNKNTWPGLELVVKSGDTRQNSTIVAFNNEMTLGLDPSYDVGKLKGNPDIALYTKLVEDNGVDFAIQALPEDDIENLTVPVGIDVSEEMICDFSVYHEFMESWPIYLEDTKENTITNLKEENYSTLVTESGTGRFYLHFKDVSGIEEEMYNVRTIRVYASGKTLYVINPERKRGTIRIFNLTGQEVANLPLTGDTPQQQALNVNNVFYIVQIQTSKEVISDKVFIK